MKRRPINTKYCYKELELCPNRGKAGEMGREKGAKGGSANSNHKFGTPLQSVSTDGNV